MLTDKICHLTASAALLLSLCGCGKSENTDSHVPVHGVYVAIPEAVTGGRASIYSATVEEGKRINVSFKTGGQIRRLAVGEGDYVRKGQPLGFLDDVDYKLAVDQLTAQYDQMTGEMKRLDEMYARHNIAPNDYEKAKSGYLQLRAQLDMTRNKLAYATLEAPADGYVVEQLMEEGEMTGAGTPVFRIIDSSRMEASVALPAAVYAGRHDIKAYAGRTSVTGDRDIALEPIGCIPDADNNALYRMRLRVPQSASPMLAPGMNMTVRLQYEDSDSSIYRLPSRSLFQKEGKTCVWVVNPADSTLSVREVKVTGLPDKGFVTVSGITQDDRIVAAGVHHLSDREKVGVIDDIRNLEKHVGL